MTISYFSIFDDFLDNPQEHLADIRSGVFEDVDTNIGLFKGIQVRNNDTIEKIVTTYFPFHTVNMNFVRRSPIDQDEPTFIHSDAGQGDVTCILYLSENHPKDDGTTIYNSDNPEDKSVVFYSKFNRMLVFDSHLFHSRNIFRNFGSDDTARLIQVLFLKRK